MHFFKDTIHILKETAWPTKKEAWTDFMSVLQYSAFFVLLIYLFDIVVSKGLLSILAQFE